ncbi:hypothetical protein Dsin_032107 [Dipteronia sinensis]|uniref:DUF1985 domain-containing protein n=1 Tax=Dipteronia sinensis TaxID=43782 RepID=A0AAD9ZMA2_9ROSI|nr:hypothetical protein Dsin_032107 [Dipteronia sinensis]
MHRLLGRELYHDGLSDKMRFMLDPRSIQFSRVEFCLITGLKFGAIPDTELYRVEMWSFLLNLKQGLNRVNAEGRASIPIWQLRLVDNLEAFVAFPWGSHVYKYSIFRFKMAILKRPLRYNIFWLAYALLVFTYEVIPSLAKQFMTPRAVGQPFPHILRWDLIRRPRGDKLDKVFNAMMFAEAELTAIEAERGLWYYQGIYE